MKLVRGATHFTSFALASLLLLGPRTSAAQESGITATLRGTVTDSSGAVAPGAQVTLTNTGTKAIQTLDTDAGGAFVFAALWPGSYVLKVELSGFKTAEVRDIVLSPNDTRGVDVTLEIGSQQDSVVVAAAADVIQTTTGAREGVITADQIENLSVISRGALELLRILPGVVAPDQTVLEVVGQDGGVNDTNGYTVNGVRSTRNAVSLDGSGVNDLTCNCGLVVSLNTDMVQEVKVQSSNFAAEYGTGGISVSAITKTGTSQFHGAGYWYGRDHRWSANDRSNSITGVEKTKSNYFYPGGNLGGPLVRDRLFFFFGLESQRQMYDAGSHLSTTISQAARSGDLSEFVANRGQNLNHPAVVNIPGGFPGEGTPAANNNLAPYVTPLGRAMANLYPLPNYSEPDNRYNYVYSVPYPINRIESRARVDWNISKNTRAYLRLAFDNENVDFPRGVWGGNSDLQLATAVLGRNRGRSYAANVVHVLSPTMTNESLASFSRVTFDNPFADPSKLRKDALGVDFDGFLGNQSPYLPVDNIHAWGGNQLGNYWTGGNDLYALSDELLFGDKLTRSFGRHTMKFGASLSRYDKHQGYPNDESGFLIFDPGSTPGSTGSQIGDLLVGRPAAIQQGSRVKTGVFRMWNFDGFAQDSWQVRSNLTLEYGLRAGHWTNNAERHGLDAWFDPSIYEPTKGPFLDAPDNQQLNGVRYAARGQAPPGALSNRPLFVVPRVNVAWDISGNGASVLRGGYGLFESRVAGDGETSTGQLMPPNAFYVGADAYYDTSLGGTGLTYDTAHLIPLDALLASQSLQTLTPRSFKFLKTHTYSLSFAQRLFWNQVLDVAYVGTTGRDLGSYVNANVVPFGALSSGSIGNADLSVPVNRVNLDASVVNSRRPFAAYGLIQDHEFEATSQYHSLQVTLSRQTGRRLQVLRGLHGESQHGPAAWLPRSVRAGSNLRCAERGPPAYSQHLVERVPAGRRARSVRQYSRARPAERLAALGHLHFLERHTNSPRIFG